MRVKRVLIFGAAGLFFIFDRYLKWQALHAWTSNRLVNRWFGWYPFFNPGVAFGVPVPGWLAIVLTIPILFLLGYFLVMSFVERGMWNVEPTQLKRHAFHATSYAFIFFGALSNFIDRIVYGHTVDYFLILTAIINLADVMIVGGFVIYLLYKSEALNPKS